MEVGRILPTEAAVILNVSPQFIRIAMQQGKLPIGTAVQMSSIWTYHISEKLLADYSGKDIQTELERIRGKRGGVDMAGMRAVHKKNGITFKYSGDLKETIEKAEKELKEKEGTTQWLFLKWQYDNARKAFEKYNRRLEDLKDFIKLAKEELAKREEAAGHGRDNTNP